jgi:hypothetical protein
MPPVPEKLMQRLHEANEQIHRAKTQLDAVDLNTEDSAQVAKALRAAEKEVEDVTREIDALLPKDKPAPPGRAAP